jgi:hypothetical protein
MKEIILSLSAILIAGCSHVSSRSPTAADISGATPDDYISETWLAEHRTEVEDQIVSYLLMVCPAAGTDYVALDATVTDSRGGTANVRGVGGATAIVSTVVLGDSPDPEHVREAATKAMAAAIADLGTKLVPHLEARK